MTRSPYLRDRLADMPAFRDRDRPLPMTPVARCNRATSEQLPQRDPDLGMRHLTDCGLPPWLAAVPEPGSLAVVSDDSIPDGVIEIDGTQITLAEMRAACEGP